MVFSREAGPLKIATFNINNINKRLNNLTAWLAREQPDVVCLQELKVEQRAFPASTLRDLGYGGVWLGERSWKAVLQLSGGGPREARCRRRVRLQSGTAPQ
jgi:exodeoxyribonuclease-3